MVQTRAKAGWLPALAGMAYLRLSGAKIEGSQGAYKKKKNDKKSLAGRATDVVVVTY